MKNQIMKKALLDTGMLAVFVLLMNTAITGIAAHEALGVLLVAMAAAHLSINRPWLAGALRANRPKSVRWRCNAALNAMLAVTGIVVTLTGVMISQYFFVPLNASNLELWTRVHGISATAMLAALLAHAGLHLRWIRGVLRGMSQKFGRARAMAARIAVGLMAAGAVLSLFASGSRTLLYTSSPRRQDAAVQSTDTINATVCGQGKDGTTLAADSGTQDQMTLQEFLSSFYCTACRRHCPLSNPRCGRARPQIEEQTVIYNETYGQQDG